MKRLSAIAILLVASTPASAAADDPFARGVAALRQGRPKVARVELMNAIKARPADAQPHLLQARVHLLLDDGIAAEAEVRRARALGSPDRDSRHLMAEALLLQGKPDAALASIAEGRTRFPAAVARIEGRAYHRLGRTADAGLAFSRALELAPTDHRSWVEVARFRLDTGERAGAILAADRALGLAPRDVPALVLRGMLTRTQYGLKAALPWFARASAIDPEHVPAWTERAATLGDLGRTRPMLAATRRALALSPDNPAARYLQTVLAARARNFALARSLYARIGPIAAAPAGLLLGAVLDLDIGNAEQAIGRLNALVAQQPGNLVARRLLGLAHLRNRDGVRAIAVLRPMEGEAVADSYTLTLLAAAYAQTGNVSVARRALARSAGPRPGTGLLPVDFGVAVPGLGGSRAAQIRWQAAYGSIWGAINQARAVAIETPGAPEAHVLVGDVSMLNGFARAAAAEYRRAANLAFTETTALRLVEALQVDGRGEEARVALALFLDQNPRNLSALRLLGNMRLAARNRAGAIIAYDRVLARTGPHDAVLLNNMAWAHHERGDAARGLAFARAAHAAAPDNAATADALGWMLLKSNDGRAAALTLLHKAAR